MVRYRFLVPLAVLSLLLHHAHAAKQPDQLPDTVCTTAGQPVDDQGFVRIGGIEQWVRIKGSSCANPLPTRESIDATLALARAAGDTASVDKIEALGPLPWTNPRSTGIFRRVIRKYEGLRTEPVPAAWTGLSPEYLTAQYEADYTAGEDYSWLQFVGLKGNGIASKIDLYQLGPRFEMPFYMVQGEQDLLTMPAPSKRYFDFIEAPHKEFVLVPRTGHDPNPPMVATQLQLLKKIGNCR